MRRINPSKVLLAPGFLAGLAVLLANDFVFKEAFGNSLTGKLSDFAGLFIFPYFLAAFFPTKRTIIYSTTAIMFCVWKSPVASLLIDFVNGLGHFAIGRTVDYTDLVALVVLPASMHYLYSRTVHATPIVSPARSSITALVAIVSIFAFGATTMADDRSVTFDRVYYTRLRLADVRSVMMKNELVLDLEFERQTQGLPTNGGSEVNADTWHGSFSLDQRTCGSITTRFHFVLTDTTTGSQIAPGSANFQCSDERMQPTVNAATIRYKEELQAAFEREVIRPLTLEDPK